MAPWPRSRTNSFRWILKSDPHWSQKLVQCQVSSLKLNWDQQKNIFPHCLGISKLIVTNNRCQEMFYNWKNIKIIHWIIDPDKSGNGKSRNYQITLLSQHLSHTLICGHQGETAGGQFELFLGPWKVNRGFFMSNCFWHLAVRLEYSLITPFGRRKQLPKVGLNKYCTLHM